MESMSKTRLPQPGWTAHILTFILLLGCTAVTYVSFTQDGVDGCAGSCSSVLAVSSGTIIQEKQDTKFLPSFQQGGIIFFLHVPKTGGVSVRKALEKGKGEYILSDNHRKFNHYKQKLAYYTKHGTQGKVVVFELHASDSPTLMQVSSRLHKWRATAKQHNVPFFAFTVLREPVSMAVSFFNFYYGMDHHDSHYQYFEDPSEQDFVNNTVFNPQCGFLAKSDRIFYQKREQQLVQRRDCDAAYTSLRHNMDWIGATDLLSSETFPLLRTLIGSNTNADHLAPENIITKNKSPPKILQADLSPKTIELVHKMTIWDQKMYEQAQHDYPYSRMQIADNGDFT